MKTAVSVAAIVFLAANVPSAHARIGETREQCIKRYGTPTETKGETYIFAKNGLRIRASFDEQTGRCVVLSISKEIKYDLGGFSEDGLKYLLDANMPEYRRSLDHKDVEGVLMSWSSRDGTVWASYDLELKHLMFRTMKSPDQNRVITKDDLEGF